MFEQQPSVSFASIVPDVFDTITENVQEYFTIKSTYENVRLKQLISLFFFINEHAWSS